jgi:N-acetylglucosamine-6-phosphate deacetylase
VKLEGLLPEGVWGRVHVEDGRVARVEPCARGAAPERLLVPGFVDLHVHGGGGADVMDGAEGIAATAAFHLGHGTTSLCPTTITRPVEELLATLRAAGSLGDDPRRARLLGVHLEGPFLAHERMGAQPPYELAPELSLLDRLLDAGPVATLTLAPELPNALDLIARLVERGVRASLGHSACTQDEGQAGYAAGAVGTTHLFNAMTGLHHRTPGLVAAALDAGPHTFHELILDLHHVHPAMVALAARTLRGRLCLVSDAIPATGLPEGESRLGGQRVFVREGQARLVDGTLAGSVLTLERAFRHALRGPKLAADLSQAVRWSATNPADALGRHDLGRIEVGAWADLVLLDEHLDVLAVWRSGREVTPCT